MIVLLSYSPSMRGHCIVIMKISVKKYRQFQSCIHKNFNHPENKQALFLGNHVRQFYLMM